VHFVLQLLQQWRSKEAGSNNHFALFPSTNSYIRQPCIAGVFNAHAILACAANKLPYFAYSVHPSSDLISRYLMPRSNTKTTPSPLRDSCEMSCYNIAFSDSTEFQSEIFPNNSSSLDINTFLHHHSDQHYLSLFQSGNSQSAKLLQPILSFG